MCEGERGRLPHSFEIVRALRSRARQCRCDGRPEVHDSFRYVAKSRAKRLRRTSISEVRSRVYSRVRFPY